jgi:hypothetical protein
MNSLKIPRGYQKPLIEEGDNTMVKRKAYPSGAPEFTPVFSVVYVARSVVFHVMFFRSLFVLLSFFF